LEQAHNEGRKLDLKFSQRCS